MLVADGHEVVVANDPAAALCEVEELRPELILVDVRLPETEGFAWVRFLRSRDEMQDVPILLLSGRPESRWTVAGLDAGANDYLTKPVDPAELRARVRSHLRAARRSATWRAGSFIDPLTGLLNRRGVMEGLRREVDRALRERKPLSLLFADLDEFKAINDRFGHGPGDVVLAATARVLAGIVRSFDVAARFGGDEFVVVLPGADGRQALHVAQRLRDALAELRTAPIPWQVRASIGSATLFETPLDEEKDAAEGLMEAADHAMYLEKRSRPIASHRVMGSRAHSASSVSRIDDGRLPPASCTMREDEAAA
jgi:diguanylate cyclase (GGDEF)-like protein